jgi:Uma2 family endonuclease
MEVVSEDTKHRERDYEQKQLDYAEAKVAEYWIVDYERRSVLVQRLDGDRYTDHGQFTPGQQATSKLLDGFSIDVAALFAVAEDVPE